MIDKVVNYSNEIESKTREKEKEEKELKETEKESIEICESIFD